MGLGHFGTSLNRFGSFTPSVDLGHLEHPLSGFGSLWDTKLSGFGSLWDTSLSGT